MGQAQINVRTRACSRTSIARTKQAALTHNVRGKELMRSPVYAMFKCVHLFAFLKIAASSAMLWSELHAGFGNVPTRDY